MFITAVNSRSDNTRVVVAAAGRRILGPEAAAAVVLAVTPPSWAQVASDAGSYRAVPMAYWLVVELHVGNDPDGHRVALGLGPWTSVEGNRLVALDWDLANSSWQSVVASDRVWSEACHRLALVPYMDYTTLRKKHPIDLRPHSADPACPLLVDSLALPEPLPALPPTLQLCRCDDFDVASTLSYA